MSAELGIALLIGGGIAVREIQRQKEFQERRDAKAAALQASEARALIGGGAVAEGLSSPLRQLARSSGSGAIPVGPGGGNWFPPGATPSQQSYALEELIEEAKREIMSMSKEEACKGLSRLADDVQKRYGNSAANDIRKLQSNATSSGQACNSRAVVEGVCGSLGATIGSVGAGALCGLSGAGSGWIKACSFLGSIVGGWIGKEVGPWVADRLDDVWGKVEDGADWVWDRTIGQIT